MSELPRFSWPMRLFLAFLLFWMTFRSFIVLVSERTRDRWMSDLAMDYLPEPSLPIPDPAIDAAAYRERLMVSMDGLWTFARPWPGPKSRERIASWQDGAAFALVWVDTRLSFLERVVGAPQGWDMFTPDVSTERTLPRARLFFADGSERLVKSRAEPDDLTHFGHWFNYFDLRVEQVAGEGNSRGNLGYCNLLRHRHPSNEAGSPLVRIALHDVTYYFPPPGVDPTAFLAEQTRKTREGGDQVSADYYEYDAVRGTGRALGTE